MTLLSGLLIATGLASVPASAMEYKQVGTPDLTASFGNTTSNFPVYTMEKYGQGINIYKKEAIGMDAGLTIREISFIGYQSSEKDYTDANLTVYVGNTTSVSYTDFVVAGETEGGKATTVFDTSKATLFYDGPFEQAVAGAKGDPVEILKVTSPDGVEYTGDNLVVYIYLSTPKASTYMTFYTAKAQGTTFKNLGAYRNSNYTPEQYNGGYSVFTKSWSTPGTSDQVPVMTLGYEAGMNEKQVGEISTSSTSSYPVYTMSKYGQGINIYTNEVLGLDAGTSIREVGFMGYQSSEKNFEGATAKVYLANGTSKVYTDYLTAGESEGGNATTVPDMSKFTLFYEGPLDIPVAGSKDAPVEILTFKGDSPFEYDGNNLVVVVEFSVPKASVYTSFMTSKASGVTFKNLGAYRESGYTTPGYGINTKKWSTPGTSDQVPVMVVRYGGAAQAISAIVSGKVFSGLDGKSIQGATVELRADNEPVATATSAGSGYYEFTVEAVDTKAVYTVTASCAGYETQSVTPDLKAGGNISDVNITLPKLPVPAVLSGYVIDKESREPVPGVALTFNGLQETSGENGAYSFNIANIDLLPADGVQLAAVAKGYNDYSTSLRLTGDMDFNIELLPLPALEGEGTQVGEYTVNDYDYQVPFNTLWKESVTEVIYPKELLGGLTEGEKYSSVSFYGYLSPKSSGTDPTEPGDGDDDYGYDDYYGAPAAPASYYADITVYMVDTEQTQFAAASTGEDLTSMQKLFEGTVEITEGGQKNAPKLLFTADFETPYVYGGKNVKLIVKANCSESRLVYFALDPAAKNNVLTRFADKNLEEENWRMVTAGVPVMKLGAYVPVAEVNGTVTDKYSGTPLAGAEITLAYETEKYTATTDDNGVYAVSIRSVKYDTDYTVSVSYGNYNELTEEVSFDAEKLVKTIDFALAQEGTVSGKVRAESGEPVAGAKVTMSYASGDVTGSASTGADGEYEIYMSEVEYGTYKIAVEAEKYKNGETSVELTLDQPSATDVDVVLEAEKSGIAAVFAEGKTADVYTIGGILLKKDASEPDLRNLPAGIYVVAGMKLEIKK